MSEACDRTALRLGWYLDGFTGDQSRQAVDPALAPPRGRGVTSVVRSQRVADPRGCGTTSQVACKRPCGGHSVA